MLHRETLILGVIAAVTALVLQVVLSLFVSDFFAERVLSPSDPILLFSIVMSALIEESVRVGLLFFYCLKKGFAQAKIAFGATMGIGFALTEIALRAPQVSTSLEIYGLIGLFIIHVLLGVLAMGFLMYFRRFSVVFSVLFLTFIHVCYNFFVLYLFPFFSRLISS